MALIKCPECRRLGFTWSVDEEVTSLTMWQCHLCGYAAREDESKEEVCPACGEKQLMLLADRDKIYR